MTNWYYHDAAQGRVGPIDADAVRGHYREGRIHRDTLLWREGLREWQPLERLSNELGLDDDLLSSAPRPVAPPPLPPQTPTASGPPPYSTRSAHSANPADAAAAHFHQRQAPPPRRGLSGCAIVAIVLAVVAIPMVGILAAIALPAYQDYTVRAKVTEAINGSGQYKLQVAEYVAANQECPGNDSKGFQPAVAYAGPRVASVKFGELEGCGIEIELRGIGSKADGQKIWLELDPSSGEWTCSSEIEDRLLPQSCRG